MENMPHRLLLWVIVLFLVGILFMGAFYLDHSTIIVKNQYIESFDRSIIQLNSSISEFFSTFENALEMFSKNEMVQNVSDDPEEYYLSTMQLFKSFQQSYSSTAFAYFAPNKTILENKKLVTWPDTSEQLANTEWVAYDRPWYKNAVAADGKIAWTKPYVDATTKKPIITISKTVKNRNNEFKGVMAIDFFLDELSNKVENFKAFKQGYAFIVDQDKGNPVFISKDMKDRKFDEIIHREWMNKVFVEKSGSLRIKEKSVDYYVTFTTNEPTGWKVLGIIEEEKIYKTTKDMMHQIFTSSFIIMLIGILSILYILRQITKGVKDLSDSLTNNENDTMGMDDLSNKFNALLNEDYEDIIDETSSYMNLLFESQLEMEKIMDILHDLKSDCTLEKLKDLEGIVDQLIYFRNELDHNSSRLQQIQKENVENHMDLVLEEIKAIKKRDWDSKRDEILYRIEKKIIMQDVEI